MKTLKKVEVTFQFTNGEVFHYFDHIKVFYKSDGEIVSLTDKMCKVLNNYERSF